MTRLDAVDAPTAVQPESLRLWLMLALTFVTGVVDAVGYIGLDHIFTGNMTGNFVFIALSIAGSPVTTTVWGPIAAVVAFSIGAFIAGAVLRGRPKGWNRRVTVLLACGAALLAGVGIATPYVAPTEDALLVRTGLAALIAVQMGAQAMIARRLSVADMTTVVVTSTLTSAMGESPFAPRGRVFNRRLGAILALVLGAIVGAVTMRLGMIVPIMGVAILTLGVAIVGARAWTWPGTTPAE